MVDTFPGFEFRPEFASIPSDTSANRLLARKVGGKKEKRRRKKAEPPFQKIPRNFFLNKRKNCSSSENGFLVAFIMQPLARRQRRGSRWEEEERRNTPFSRTHTFFSFLLPRSSCILPSSTHWLCTTNTSKQHSYIVGRTRGNRASNETKVTRRDETRDGLETRFRDTKHLA